MAKEDVLLIVGGASFPAVIGTMNISWPLAVLRCNEDGISVDPRSSLLKRALRRFMKSEISQRAAEDIWWSSTWDGLSSVRLATKSIVLENAQKDSCKFVTVTRESMKPLILELERRHITVQRVRNNFYFTGSDR
jgi:hypothetical protein